MFFIDININGKAINKLLFYVIISVLLCVLFAIIKYVGIGLLIIKIIRSFVPVLLAIFISFILEPTICFFTSKGIKRKYSVIVSYFSLLIFIGFILYLIIPSLIEQAKIFIENVPIFIKTIKKLLINIGVVVKDDTLDSIINSFFIKASNSVISYFNSSLSIAFDVLLAVSGSIFLSLDFKKFKESVKNKLPSIMKKPIVFYFQTFLPFVYKYFSGMIIDSFLIFIISIIGFSIIGIEYVLVISLVIALTNLIPIIGPYIGGIPAAITGFSVSTSLGVSAIIVVLIVQIIESNFLQPIILKNVISLHPIEGILGISLFGSLFGIFGMIASPILIVAFKLLFIPYKDTQEYNSA